MKIDGEWIPESDAELELMEALHKAKVNAYNNGVEPDQIAAIMSFMSSASLVNPPESDINEKSLQEEMKKEQQKADNCPRCGVEIRDAEAMGIGGDFYLIPCGHEFEWEDREEIGPWIEDPVDNNGH